MGIEDKLEEEVKQAEKLNTRLTQDIELIKENQPLLEEKLELEEDAILVIEGKQKQANDALKAATKEMNIKQEDFAKLKQRSEDEQQKMAAKVASLSKTLNESLEALFNAQKENVRM